jgi:hypothetical protein
MQEIA